MSVLVSAYVWRHSQSKGSTRLVLLALADLADDDGLIPPHRSASIEYLTKKCNFDSERTTRYCLRELEGKDLVEGEKVIRAGIQPPELATEKGAGRRTSRYQVLMRQLPLFGPGGKHVEHDLPAEVAVDKIVENPAGEGQAPAPLPGKASPGRAARKAPERGNALPPTARVDVTARDGRIQPPGPPPVDKTGTAAKPEAVYSPSPAVISWAAQHGYGAYLHLHVDYFIDYIANPDKRRRYAANLDAAFRNSVRSDWGDVRMQAQRAARLGQGPDLERWWVTNDGFKAKGNALGMPWDKDKFQNFTAYQVAVTDAAIDRDGWGGGWANPQSGVYTYVLARRKKRGADIPEEEAAHA